MDAAQEEKLKRVFHHFDQDRSGLIDITELKQILAQVGISLDTENINVLVRRYDDDHNGRLNFDEFAELFVLVLNLKKQFQAADADNSNSISAKELAAVIQGLKLKATPQCIGPVLRLFDDDGSGTVNFQEYLALVFYFQELEYQYDSYIGEIRDYSWLVPLLGVENQKNVPVVARKLQEWKQKKQVPSFDEFCELIVKEAVAGNCDPTGRKKKKGAPLIDVARNRNRTRAPKRNLKLSAPVAAPVGQITTQVQNLSVKTTGKDGWIDPNFNLGASVLPASARAKVFSWKRPIEINPGAQLFVEGVDEGDVIQGGLGDCWFLGALAVVATSTDNFVEHLFVQKKQDVGYYQCRFYKNGAWQTVEIDDKLPVGHSGRLYFASCKDPTEFWVPLVEKAYAKLHGSYESIEMGNIADGLKDLTGEAVEVLLMDDANFNMTPDQLWKTLVHNIKESFLMGCSKEDSHAKAESVHHAGLLFNHAYSIIDAEEVQGHKLLRIRNPWGRGEWTGAWGDGSKEWTPALLKHFKYDFANDGTFFMSFNDFRANFNRIYVLRLMTDSEGEVWNKFDFHGEFNLETAGGCTNFASWVRNPQYGLTVSKPNTKVFLNFSQPDLRYVLKQNPATYRRPYDPVGIVVMKADHTNFKKTSFTQEDRVSTSLFCGMRDISLEFVAQPGINYVIMPCTFNPGVQFKFELTVYTEHKSKVFEITKDLPKKQLRSLWSGPTAGGCVNYPQTWLKNPQFLLEVNSNGTVIITLEQELTPNDQPECIGIYAFANRQQPARIERLMNPTVSPKTFLNVVSCSEELKAAAGVYHIIMPTTFDPLNRGFSISVASPDTNIKTFRPI